jgi:hypothetical protein
VADLGFMQVVEQPFWWKKMEGVAPTIPIWPRHRLGRQGLDGHETDGPQGRPVPRHLPGIPPQGLKARDTQLCYSIHNLSSSAEQRRGCHCFWKRQASEAPPGALHLSGVGSAALPVFLPSVGRGATPDTSHYGWSVASCCRSPRLREESGRLMEEGVSEWTQKPEPEKG